MSQIQAGTSALSVGGCVGGCGGNCKIVDILKRKAYQHIILYLYLVVSIFLEYH